MTPVQRDLAKHALGIGRGDGRNYFVADEGSSDFAEWTAMVQAGWATSRPYALAIRDTVFRLTEEGERLARVEPIIGGS